MSGKPSTGVVLKQTAEGEFKYKDADFPVGDNSLAYEIMRFQEDWQCRQICAKDGGIDSICQLDIYGSEIPTEIERETVIDLIAPFMTEIRDSDNNVAYQKMLAAAAAHPLSGGFFLEVDGELRSLCGPISDAEIAERAKEILDIRDEQRLLKDLKILGYNDDKRTRFLIVETADDKAEFVRRYQLSLEEDMDLIVEVKVDKDYFNGQIKFQDPVGAFHLSKNPRFDYDSRVLTGVTSYHPLNDHRSSHDDIWGARAVMRRLPDEDIIPEDVRYHIGTALHNLSDESPEPS